MPVLRRPQHQPEFIRDVGVLGSEAGESGLLFAVGQGGVGQSGEIGPHARQRAVREREVHLVHPGSSKPIHSHPHTGNRQTPRRRPPPLIRSQLAEAHEIRNLRAVVNRHTPQHRHPRQNPQQPPRIIPAHRAPLEQKIARERLAETRKPQMPNVLGLNRGLQHGIRVQAEIVAGERDRVEVVEDGASFGVDLAVRAEQGGVRGAADVLAEVDRVGEGEEVGVDFMRSSGDSLKSGLQGMGSLISFEFGEGVAGAIDRHCSCGSMV
ncbi:hypothetical protein LTR01_008372 [Friedmanniomyces endolithicus]|nr:hypothetical protein LTR01_008372 [Friedmanniomyces endolithicus]